MLHKASLAAILLAVPALSFGAVSDDHYIAGYAAAVLEREFSLRSEGLVVADGHVRYPESNLSNTEKSQLIKSLGSIKGVIDVTLFPVNLSNKSSGESATSVAASESKASGLKITPVPSTQPVSVANGSGGQTTPVAAASNEPKTTLLSIGRTFDPLMADPLWPHFFASYQKFSESGVLNLDNATSVGMGETIALLRQDYPSGFRWESGIQAGVFAQFDMDSSSADLINANYFVGPYVALRFDKLSILTRVFHESTHLGDEYLGRLNHVPRVNYSFEEAQVLLSYDLPEGFRVYGGAGFGFDQDPNDELHPLSVQYGAEWRSPHTYTWGLEMRPVAGVDIQQRDTNDWRFGYSIRAGVQIEDSTRFSQRLQILLEYYNGDSTIGQFYKDRNEYVGFGAHFFF